MEAPTQLVEDQVAQVEMEMGNYSKVQRVAIQVLMNTATAVVAVVATMVEMVVKTGKDVIIRMKAKHVKVGTLLRVELVTSVLNLVIRL